MGSFMALRFAESNSRRLGIGDRCVRRNGVRHVLSAFAALLGASADFGLHIVRAIGRHDTFKSALANALLSGLLISSIIALWFESWCSVVMLSPRKPSGKDPEHLVLTLFPTVLIIPLVLLTNAWLTGSDHLSGFLVRGELIAYAVTCAFALWVRWYEVRSSDAPSAQAFPSKVIAFFRKFSKTDPWHTLENARRCPRVLFAVSIIDRGYAGSIIAPRSVPLMCENLWWHGAKAKGLKLLSLQRIAGRRKLVSRARTLQVDGSDHRVTVLPLASRLAPLPQGMVCRVLRPDGSMIDCSEWPEPEWVAKVLES